MSYSLGLEQFEMDVKRELNNFGLSTKIKRGLFGSLSKKNSAKETVFFTSPDFSSFSCNVEYGLVKEIDLSFTCTRLSSAGIEKHLNTMGKIYYACGLAIDRDTASKIPDIFLSLRSIRADRFESMVNVLPDRSHAFCRIYIR